MAVDNAESHPAAAANSDSVAPAPDSSPLRVTRNTQLESGIPPARQPRASTLGHAKLTLDDGLQQMETALDNASRTEVNLGLLTRGLQYLATSTEAARRANTELIHELDELRADLCNSQGEERALRFRMQQLEQQLMLIRRETQIERDFLIDQQDRFLRELLADHERQLSDLRLLIREPEPRKGDAEQIAELTAQRDQARQYAIRCERERDLAWEELATGVAPPTERMQRSPSGAAAIASISLRTVPVHSGQAEERQTSTSYSISGEEIGEEDV